MGITLSLPLYFSFPTLAGVGQPIIHETKHSRYSTVYRCQTPRLHQYNRTQARHVRSQFVHSHIRMNIDPRIPTMPGRSTSGFHQPGRHCLHQATSTVRCLASRMKGELHPAKNLSKDGLRHFVPNFLLMNNSTDELLCFLVWPLQRRQ